MSDITTAFWGMTINNYDETDLALVRQGYPDFIRQIVYTLEKGEEKGTPHIQAYVKLFRQQRMSYIRKLFPGASDFKALTHDEYKLNAQRYAQKLDGTAQSPATINNNPFPDPVVELTDVIEAVYKEYGFCADLRLSNSTLKHIETEERERVVKNPRLAKFYVSATYRAIKKEFWNCILTHVMEKHEVESGHIHTHTHSENLFSHEGSINHAADDQEDDETQPSGEGSEDSEGEDHEDGGGETDEGYSEGSGSESDAQDDWEGYRKQGNR